ncbi:uncharacterized protein ASPGLDRAFT_108928, partial [Aspergillus glaucus CBS 516.65]
RNIRRLSLYRIAGAFRTTSRAALEICLNIPPPMIALEPPRNARERCMQWATSPDHDPLTSPLEQWEQRTAISQDKLEIIHPHVTLPWWAGLKPHIAETQEAALTTHNAILQSRADIIVYTDGSLTEQGVGAAVVSSLGCQAVCIGSQATHTVYAVELQG